MDIKNQIQSCYTRLKSISSDDVKAALHDLGIVNRLKFLESVILETSETVNSRYRESIKGALNVITDITGNILKNLVIIYDKVEYNKTLYIPSITAKGFRTQYAAIKELLIELSKTIDTYINILAKETTTLPVFPRGFGGLS